MRREFIFVLLGIIIVSTISSILDGYTHIVPDKVLLDTVLGAVGAGNFSYWQLGHSGPLLVELNSLSGDADLYVADNISPSYETDRNNFSSVTCGQDQVYIPASFPRPIESGLTKHVVPGTLVKYMVRVLRGELHHPAVLAALRLRAPNDYLGARRRPAMLEVPKCIGVFGYWSHRLSEYSIQVYQDGAGGPVTQPTAYRAPDKFDPKKHGSEAIPKKDKKKPMVMKFLNIVDTILDMFVL